MPKKQNNETKAEQIEKFRAEVARLIAAGDLDPSEADEALDALSRKLGPEQRTTMR
jgi:hypothetical protein